MAAKLYDVEHALSLYALSFYNLPARNIYDDDLIDKLGERVKKCHIYMIGFVPILDLTGARQDGPSLIIEYSLKGDKFDVSLPLPDGFSLHFEEDLWYLSNGDGNRYGPTEDQMFQAFLHRHGQLEFRVVYIGQAYGKDGSRNALDRLQKHETLQKIALKGVPEGCKIEVLLLEIEPANQIFTVFNPFAQDKKTGSERIRDGLDKLFGTDDHERITLYEASLIRYFQPQYNKEFIDSFPSTNLKVLSDCYEKDFSAIIAEICFDEFPYALQSDKIAPKLDHIIRHDLHTDANRKAFFSGD